MKKFKVFAVLVSLAIFSVFLASFQREHLMRFQNGAYCVSPVRPRAHLLALWIGMASGPAAP